MRQGPAAGLLLAAALRWSAEALDPGRAVTQYEHRAWRPEDGLPQSSVQAIHQTRDGYLWLGTQEGLVRFDGLRFTVFDRKRVPAMTSNNILALHQDADGTLWIGTHLGGLLSLAGGRVRAHACPGVSVLAITGDGAGGVWVATNAGLARVSGGRCAPLVEGGPAPPLASLLHWNGRLLAGAFAGDPLVSTDGASLTPFQGASPDLKTPVLALASSPSGDLYAGTDKGLFILRSGAGTPPSRLALTEHGVNALLFDRDGHLWIGTEGGGLLRARAGDPGPAARYGTGQGLTSDTVRALSEDREGNLWVGTDAGGLDRLRDTRLVPFGVLEGLTNASVYSVLEARDGTLWVGTKNGGLNRIAHGRVTAFLQKSGLSASTGFAMAEARDGSLWIGTDGHGALRLVDGRVAGSLTMDDGLPSNQVYSLLEDRSGGLWIGTTEGVVVRRGGRVEPPQAREPLPPVPVAGIAEDEGGAIWLGTLTEGLLRLKDGAVTRYGTAEGLLSPSVVSLNLGRNGAIWIGTDGGGIARVAGGRLTSWGPRDGLLSELVYQVLEDDEGRIFLSCNKGIYSMRVDDLETRARGGPPARATLYGKVDGMRSLECNGTAQPSGWKTRDGRLVFPTQGGLTFIDRERLSRKNPVPPAVHVEEVLLDGRPVAGSEAVVIPKGARRSLEVRYTGVSLSAPEKVTFRYRMEGFEDGREVDAGTRRAAFFTNVPPGRYTFQVSAANEDGVVGRGATLALTVEPRFHETPPFFGAVALAAAGAGWGLYRLRLRRLKAQFAAVLRERTRMSREIHDTLAQGLTGIVLQLQVASASLDSKRGALASARQGDGDSEAEDRIERARKLASLSLEEVRRSIWSLRSKALEEGGLDGALARMAKQMAEGRDVAVQVTSSGPVRGLRAELEAELFRIGQEAVWNALKYSGARTITVEVGATRKKAWVKVRDDGKGFDPSKALSSTLSGGYGLGAMRQRAEALGGTLVVTSEEGKGSEVAAEVSR